jgi:photosystem II stability/assembly factor-like uncharacterized protein
MPQWQGHMFIRKRSLTPYHFTHIEISKRYSVARNVNDLGERFSDILRTLSFANASCGWASGGGGQLVQTTNGGIDWRRVRLPTPGLPYLGVEAVHPFDCDSSWLLANLSGDVKLFFSADGGTTWSPRAVDSAQNRPTIRSSFFFLNRTHGWIVCRQSKGRRIDNSVSLTSDGGESWRTVPLATKGDPFKMAFVDRSMGWIIEHRRTANNIFTNVYRTTDSGWTWSHVSQLNGEVTNFVARARDLLFVTGWRGLLLRSRDGARTWERLRTGTRLIVSDIHIRGPIGLAVGSSDMLRSRRSALLLLSTDGGENWRRIESPIRDTFFSVYLTGWDRGVLASPYALYRFKLRERPRH